MQSYKRERLGDIVGIMTRIYCHCKWWFCVDPSLASIFNILNPWHMAIFPYEQFASFLLVHKQMRMICNALKLGRNMKVIVSCVVVVHNSKGYWRQWTYLHSIQPTISLHYYPFLKQVSFSHLVSVSPHTKKGKNKFLVLSLLTSFLYSKVYTFFEFFTSMVP